jgi:uncharacterized protein
MINHQLRLACSLILSAASFVFAANAGDPGATSSSPSEKVALAIQYLSGNGMAPNVSKGFQLMEEAAATGDADALCGLGACYALGQGVSQDDVKARALFERSTEAGSTAGASNLGNFLVRGRGGEADVDRGLFLLNKCAQKGHLPSALLLGEVYIDGTHADGKSDYRKAYEILKMPASQGDPVAQNFIGILLKDGRLGDERKPESRLWLERAALQGNGKACFNLALLWNPNSSDKMARVEAMRWLLVGAELGEPLSARMIEDVRPGFAEQDFSLATNLALVTWQQALRRAVTDSFGRPSIPGFSLPPADPERAEVTEGGR